MEYTSAGMSPITFDYVVSCRIDFVLVEADPLPVWSDTKILFKDSDLMLKFGASAGRGKKWHY